ncbi:MAG: glycosyltransferase [Clostridiales bacterium]|nr:glycosyltransferase [Clostridiales bacterium]
MPEISVIVPVYKVEPYLHRCVDSILNQTFQDFELILVDDGSPDHCPAICDEYAQKDSRILTIHVKNGGGYLMQGILHLKGLQEIIWHFVTETMSGRRIY